MPLVWVPTETDADPTTTIAAPGVLIGDDEVTVTDTASMPPVGYIGWAVIDDEVITVTGAADNPYPIDRAQAGTVEADHSAGAAFNWTVVPATVIALVKEQVTASDLAAIESSSLDTDGTLAANSDAKVATQKAVKTYADTKAADSAVLHNTGNETSSGIKTGLLGPAGAPSATSFRVGGAGYGPYSSGGNKLDFAAGGVQMLNMQAGSASTFKNYPLRADKGYYPTIKKLTAASFSNLGGGLYVYSLVDSDPDVLQITELPSGASAVQFWPATSIDVKETAIEDCCAEYFAGFGCATQPVDICDLSLTLIHTINTDGGTASIRMNNSDFVAKISKAKA